MEAIPSTNPDSDFQNQEGIHFLTLKVEFIMHAGTFFCFQHEFLIAITCFLLLFCRFLTLNIDLKFAQGGNKEARALSVNEKIAPASKQLTWPFEVKMVRF
jgi:hypothetical protein